MIISESPDSAASVGARLARLEAVEAIRDMKARYGAWADAKYTPDHRRQPAGELREAARQQALCFAEDAEWHAGPQFGGTIRGRQALFEWFCRAPWTYAAHFYGSAQIQVHDASSASGQWRLWQMAITESDGEGVLLAGVTDETYRRLPDGAWVHQSVRFLDLQIMTLSGAALARAPGLGNAISDSVSMSDKEFER